MPGSTARAAQTCDITFTSQVCCHAAGSVVSSGPPPGPGTPAFEKNTSIGPPASSACRTSAATSSSLLTSTRTPSPPISRATAAAPSPSRSATTTRAPSAAKRCASARPIPLAAPVTTACLSRSSTAGTVPVWSHERMEPMSSLDASFLHMEDRNKHMHIGGVSIFEGPPPPFERLEEMVAGKLALVPRYRQKVRFVPLGIGQPVWVDDPHFNLGYHLRHSALPAPGSEEQLRKMAARVFSQPLDRSKPLWELWMVEGLSENRWALLSKVHHCMVDGVAATDLMSVMFDDRTEAAADARWEPGPEPRGAELVLRTISRRTFDPREQLRTARDVARRPGESLRAGRELAGAMVAATRAARPASSSSLTGPVGPHRVWSWARVRLGDVKAVRSALGGTVNDVVLTVVAQGFRDLLDSRGEAAELVRTMVPVSVRRPGEKGTYNNRVSGVIAALPVGLDDPA